MKKSLNDTKATQDEKIKEATEKTKKEEAAKT